MRGPKDANVVNYQARRKNLEDNSGCPDYRDLSSTNEGTPEMTAAGCRASRSIEIVLMDMKFRV
jgi:hypothetical protein